MVSVFIDVIHVFMQVFECFFNGGDGVGVAEQVGGVICRDQDAVFELHDGSLVVCHTDIVT